MNANLNLFPAPLPASITKTPQSRGRVRSGCLTCRKRKVKCDEHRPICFNCDRLSRTCVYDNNRAQRESRSQPSSQASPTYPSKRNDTFIPGAHPFDFTANPIVSDAVFLSRSLAGVEHGEPTGDNMSSAPQEPSDLYSFLNDNTTIFTELGGSSSYNHGLWDLEPSLDLLAPDTPASSVPLAQASRDFSHFLGKVEPPFISSCDRVNWSRMKTYIAELGCRDSVVAAAISCVESLYDAKSAGEDLTEADSLYHAAKSRYARMLRGSQQDLQKVLIVALLLCCYEIVEQDSIPITLKSSGAFIDQLQAWKNKQHRQWPPIAHRITLWLRIFHTKAMHLGGRGFLAPKANELLAPDDFLPSSLGILADQPSPEDIVYDSMFDPLFEFYFETQRISLAISGLNRHHRSRSFPVDEIEVQQAADVIRKRLHRLWQRRPGLLKIDFGELRNHLTQGLVDKLSRYADFCNAAYHSELIYLGRGSGEWLTATPEAEEAMRSIRLIVNNDRNSGGQRLDSGYLWPLFLYAVESSKSDGIAWAVARMRQIKDPLCNSEGIADFAESLSKEQIKKGRRVDSRYFSTERFGAVPPFM
jgi:Fungal specific transcription factor domain/Fungal Zn(2)-Cys(6) binuclear cluster domain